MKGPTRINKLVQDALLAWYRAHRRDLPWRRASDPYAVWVSEVMLQQTRVSVVIDYFKRWMERFPSLERLAAASEDEVLHAWQGLGYYARARRLRQGAIYVCREHRGKLPREVPALLSIPGIGPYSAGAIASIAYGVRAPLVDGNVVRVLCRLFALAGDPTKAALKSTLWSMAADLVPEGSPADFNQALMELGATVCTPQKPSCGGCPLRMICMARASGQVSRFPELPVRAAVTAVDVAAALVPRRGRWLVVKLPAHSARWSGMWVFPSVELLPGETPVDGARRAARELVGLSVAPERKASELRHQVTRFRITLHAVLCRALAGRAKKADERVAEIAWRRADELEGLAMPAAQRRLARIIETGTAAMDAGRRSAL